MSAEERNSRAILLLQLGGPETLSDVRGFLYRLFSDPEVIRVRPAPLRRAIAPQARLFEIGSWPTQPDFVEAHAESIREELARFSDPRPESVHLLFSAHSIPKKLVTRQGDPYPSEIEASLRAILERLEWKGRSSLAYQSKLGPVEG